MADANVPIKFQIFKGDTLVREEVLAQDVIKIGKLASSHLRLDDETVSRMHAVIEASGPDEIHVVDLGSTRGTTVNGERITKARLQAGDEIMFGDCRVVISFGGDAVQATPRSAGLGEARRKAGMPRPRPPTRPRRPLMPPRPSRDTPRRPVTRSRPVTRISRPTALPPTRRLRSRALPAPAPRWRSRTGLARWRSRRSSAAW